MITFGSQTAAASSFDRKPYTTLTETHHEDHSFEEGAIMLIVAYWKQAKDGKG